MGFIFSTPAILAASGLMRPPFFKYSTVSSKISVLSRDTLLRQAAAISSCVFPAWIISSASITGIPLPRAAVRVSMISIFPSTISLAIKALW